MKIHRTFIALLLALAGTVAWAQWQWLDNQGRKVFSDRAPPPEVPEKNILKRPGASKASADAPAATVGEPVSPAAAAAPMVAASGPKGSGVDPDLEAKRKQAADAESAKRRAEEERLAKARIESCARAKQTKAAIESGVRMSQTTATGEREFMDEAARAAELKRMQAVIASDCK